MKKPGVSESSEISVDEILAKSFAGVNLGLLFQINLGINSGIELWKPN